ncbi:fumarylacetoacetase [Bordetella flabilis]|uniref:fumarylacetoacetase n=1 Tax=Bordetella flabilis TaxID=463014 RepID=A0A193GEH2_9BORD|nr:fumarylacetoacetase [Bordetella flabilis]ANN78442.1 fumarylacetoacetase [Bordetella flabilis]
MTELDHTHDPAARSWVAAANVAGSDFPLQNLPLGVFETGDGHAPRIGIAIGDAVLDVAQACRRGLLALPEDITAACGASTLNALMALGPPASGALRHAAFGLLLSSSRRADAARGCLVPVSRARMRLPAHIGDFTDFYTSIHHARRAMAAMRPGATLGHNFHTLPVAYHGRASSVVASGHACVRPRGQLGMDLADIASGARTGYAATRKLDFEAEVGCFIGAGNALGHPVDLDDAEQHVFGVCLVNDWSARDIQRWEAQPLGPFLAKSFLTTISPWVVTVQALAPFRRPPAPREADAPPPPRALTSARHEALGGLAMELRIAIATAAMKQAGQAPEAIGSPAFSAQYWTLSQMLAHHTSNGCNLRPGDLLSSGTVSGPDVRDSGCLLERTRDGQTPLALSGGEQRGYLEDGDTVELRAVCAAPGAVSIGFGVCAGTVVAEAAT